MHFISRRAVRLPKQILGKYRLHKSRVSRDVTVALCDSRGLEVHVDFTWDVASVAGDDVVDLAVSLHFH